MRGMRVFAAILLIVLGIGFLLREFGLLAFNLWGLVWPLALIALGLAAIREATRERPALESEQVAIPLGQAEKARVRIRHGASTLRLGAGAAPGELLKGTFMGGLRQEVREEGDTLVVDLRSPETGFPLFAPWLWGGRFSRDWAIDLNNQVWLELDLEVGASKTTLDLGELQVHALRMQAGASANEIVLPANARQTRVRIEAGAASTTIQVPQGVAARIRFEGGMASIDVDTHRFPRRGDVYESPDYEVADNRVDLNIEAGAASVKIH